MSCNYCGGKGVISSKNSTTITFCSHCVDARKFLYAIKVAIQKARKTGDRQSAVNLIAVNKFLPKYPVMAVLEAEAREMPDNFVSIMRKIFGVRPLR